MEMTRNFNRVVLLVAIIGALVSSSLSVALAGIGTSPSNGPARASLRNGIAFTFTGVNGESLRKGHQDEIEVVSR